MKPSFLQKLFCRIPELRGQRLLLRRIRHADAKDMYTYSRRADVTRYLLWTPHPSLEHTEQYISYLQEQYRSGALYDWAITLAESGKMIGTAGFSAVHPEHNSAEIGYVLNPDFHNRGYATEAVRLVLDFGFRVMKLHRIEARCFADNLASRRVMEKCGLSYEGTAKDGMKIKGKYETIFTYAILENEYKER